MDKCRIYLACVFVDILKGTSNDNSNNASVTTDSEMLTTNDHSLDQFTDSVGSPSDRTLVGSVSIEDVPLNDASVPVDDPAAYNDNTAEPNDSTTGPIDDATEPNDDTTEPNDETTEPNNHTAKPNDHTAESNDAICELDTSECNSNTSPITKVRNTSDHLSGTQIGENSVHKHIRASVTSPTVTVSTQKVKRSPLADLLVYPTPTQQKAKPKSSARVLTSAESIALLEEKARKKQEEKEEKERKKKEREMKRNQREEEKKRKAQEREARKAEKQKKVDQKKSKEHVQKRGNSSDRSSSTSKRPRVDSTFDESQDTGIQHREVSTNECAACFGLYEDDPEPTEWIKCTNEDCQVWSHAECLEISDNAYICVVCETLLL